jgi:hypothetical protein
MGKPLSISYPNRLDRGEREDEPLEEPRGNYSRPCSLPWCLFSAVQLVLRVGVEATAFFSALCSAVDAGLVEFESELRTADRSLVSDIDDGSDRVSTAGLVGRTTLLLGCVAAVIGIAVVVGDELGSRVWGG